MDAPVLPWRVPHPPKRDQLLKLSEDIYINRSAALG